MDADALTLKIGRMFAAAGVRANVTESGYRIFYGSTAVDIDIIAQPDRVLVHINAPLVFEVPDTPDLAHWIAVEGQGMHFGSASMRPTENGLANVWVDHTLLGDFLDEDELHTAVGAVVNLADEWDDELQKRFGGKRVKDL